MNRIGLLPALLVLVSCAKPQNSTHEFRVFQEDGLTIAETAGGPKYQEGLFSYEKVIEIRSDTTDQEAILYRPLGCTIDDDGIIYVADSSNHRIAVFNLDGQYLRSIGREGDGPGEFRYPMSVSLINGKLQIPSADRQRTTIYNTDGTLEEVVTYSHARSGSFVASAIIDPDGTRVIQRIIEARTDRFYGMSFGYCTMTPDGDTLAIIETPIVINREFIDRRAVNIRFDPDPQAFYAPGRGIFLSTGLPPEIDCYRLDGTHQRRIRLLLDDEPVTQADRERVRSYYNQQIEQADTRVRSDFTENVPVEFLERQRDNARYAEVKAHWVNTTVDDHGYFWLKRPEPTGASTYETHAHEYYVLDPEGEFLGTTVTPEVDFANIEKGYLLASVSDPETGEMVPTIYRIRPAIRGLRYP